MTFTATTDQILRDTPVYTTAAGKPTIAPAGATPIWTPGDTAVATLVPSTNNSSALITAVTPGTYTYGFSDGLGLSYTETISYSAPAAATVAPGLTVVTE